ncbi:MAG TPA: aquaporin [Tepidisphaeraceae bacterium]|nr:aquaporin [Tepidisphaeraceae bacterium]
MRAYLTEFIGTFFLVLTIYLAVSSGSPLAPLAIGASLMVMVYMGGHISGAHYNPAVSLAVMFRGKLPPVEFLFYVIAQLFGATVAALMGASITHHEFAPAPGVGVGWGAALMVEILYTFALALVVLNVATAPKTEGNSYYGLAIGFTVAAGAFAGGGISGGAFNPAVGVGPILIDTIHGGHSMPHLWLYIVGPCIGGFVAAFIFRYQNEAALPAVPTAAPAGPKEAIAPEL